MRCRQFIIPFLINWTTQSEFIITRPIILLCVQHLSWSEEKEDLEGPTRSWSQIILKMIKSSQVQMHIGPSLSFNPVLSALWYLCKHLHRHSTSSCAYRCEWAAASPRLRPSGPFQYMYLVCVRTWALAIRKSKNTRLSRGSGHATKWSLLD